jgi:myo-inositol-1(or 4)-monophosphatase
MHFLAEIPILAEETGGSRGDRYWAVDPLDGTTNFVLGMPVIAISVAMVAGGRPVVGPYALRCWIWRMGPPAGSGTGRVSAAALDLAWVAAGVFDGFFELNLGEWDVAAGAGD